MANLNFMSAMLASGELTMPSGFWESIIGWFYNFIGDYGFTILIISVLIKLLLLPIEFFQRKSTIRSTQIQQKIAPQMQKIQEKYGNDRNMLNQKQM
jgi:YidC/Oxa1 family membrane protein insertase